jgi:hypothetical protein
MRIVVYIITILLFAHSCTRNQEVPKIDYNNVQADSLTLEKTIADTTKTIIAALPLSFDSTYVLLQPSGLINIKDIKEASILSSISYSEEKSRKKEPEFYSSGIYGDELSGKISNIYFDDLTTNTQRLLTNKLLAIYKVIYLRDISKKTNKDFLLYFVYDKDTNHDGKLDSDDILSLYISKLSGVEFNKITLDNHELISTKLIPLANRYYFTTLEDIDKDGHFSKKDKYHYYYIDFSADPYHVVEYNPTNL